MVTLTKYGAKYNRNILFLEGLSTDTKPTDEFDGLSIQNGSEYTEVDTGKKFLFDYDNATWYEVQTGGGGGGGGGTSNYNDLSNRPSVNNTVLTGNKTSAQLGLASSEQGGKADTAIQGIKVNSSTVNPDANKVVNITVPTTAADVSALPDTTKYAAALSLTINSSTYVMTGQLKDQNGDNLGTAQTIDLPLESVVVGGSYNSQTKKVVLTLQNGNTIEFSVADLVSGLQTELSASNKLNPAYINYDSTHRAVSDTEKSTWNGKQSALTSAQLAAANSGITSADVAQITTNKNNILTLESKNGSKNYLNYDKTILQSLNTGGSWADNVWTIGNGVTLTVNADNSITLNGTSTAGKTIYLAKNSNITSDTYILSMTTPLISKLWAGISAVGGGEYNFTAPNSYISQSCQPNNITVYIDNGCVLDNITLYPMLCDDESWSLSHNYQQYAMSNAEITAWIKAHT